MEKISKGPVYQAYILMKIVFVVVPIIAGLDKFFLMLTDWDQYLGVDIGQSTEWVMMFVGVVEVIIGLGVIFKPRVFGYIIAVWLAFVILNLLYLGDFYDVVFGDLALCMSAFAFARLAKVCA